jgi:hypothetical protein
MAFRHPLQVARQVVVYALPLRVFVDRNQTYAYFAYLTHLTYTTGLLEKSKKEFLVNFAHHSQEAAILMNPKKPGFPVRDTFAPVTKPWSIRESLRSRAAARWTKSPMSRGGNQT